MAVDWLPDETVFSLCSRYRLLSGHRLSAETALDLFGHSRLGTAHDFPCRIDRFAARFDGNLGASDEIIRRHTILPFFLPFTSPERSALAIRTLRGDQMGSLKFALGLLTSGFRAAHPLRACPQCMREDISRHAVAPWRVSQQLPGVWFCVLHREALLVSRLKINQVQRFQFMLPAGSELIEWQQHGSTTVSIESPAVQLAHIAAEIWSAQGSVFSTPVALAKAYSAGMMQRGYRRRSGVLDQKAAAASFNRFCVELRQLPDLAALPSNQAEAQRWIGRLVHAPEGLHPLRHAITIAWLFESLTIFRKSITAVEGPNATKLPDAPSHRIREISILRPHDRDRFISLVTRGDSIRSASETVGIDVQTGLTWATQNGLRIDRRPSKLKADVTSRVIDSARAGISKAEIEDAFSISRPTLDRIIRSVPGLAAERSTAESTAKLRGFRQRWSSLQNEHASLGRKQLRLMAPDTYAWLYRVDRHWLLERSPTRAPAMHHGTSVEWNARDTLLADKIRAAALELSEANPNSRILLRHLREHVHDLAPQLRNLARLPLTEKAIRQALRYVNHVRHDTLL